jgi:hypothetical protein
MKQLINKYIEKIIFDQKTLESKIKELAT